MNVTRDQISRLKELHDLYVNDVSGAEDALAEKLIDLAPSLIETAEWARNAIESIAKNGRETKREAKNA